MIKKSVVSIIGMLALIAASVSFTAPAAADTNSEKSNVVHEKTMEVIGHIDKPKKYADSFRGNGNVLEVKFKDSETGYIVDSETGEKVAPFDRRSGDCGTSFLYLTAKFTGRGYNLSTGYRVIAPVAGWVWNVDVYGPDGAQHPWAGGPNAGRIDRTASRNVSRAGRYDGIVSSGYVLLVDGTVCGTLNPASTVYIS